MGLRLISPETTIDQESPAAGVYTRGNIVADVYSGTTVGVSNGLAITSVEGSAVAPAGSTVVADTGSLTAGTYRVSAQVAFLGAAVVAKDISVQHRDAGNAATVETLGQVSAQSGANGAAATGTVGPVTVTLVANDRIRAITGATAAAAGEVAEAKIVAQRIR